MLYTGRSCSHHDSLERLQEDSSAQLREAQNQFDEYAKKHEKLMVDTRYGNAQEKDKLDQIMRGIDDEKRALVDEFQKLNEKQAAFEVGIFSLLPIYSWSHLF